MITNIAFDVPGEPQGKGRARAATINGMTRLYTPKKTASYEGLIAMAAQQAMKGAQQMAGPCAVEVLAHFSIPKRASKSKRDAMLAGAIRPTKKPDGDNILKAVCDGINGVVWSDDVQAVDSRVVKLYGSKPGVHVMVASL